MELPEDSNHFIDSALASSQTMIKQGFLTVEATKLAGWWKQFEGREEQYFGACILDRLLFRSRPQFDSSIKSLFRGNLAGTLNPADWDGTLIENLRSSNDPKIRLVPVICETDPPTKSGPYVLRRIERLLKVNTQWMCWPWQVAQQCEEHDVREVIFVDDFLGSGNQFETFYSTWNLGVLRAEGKNMHYAPISACWQGIEHLGKATPAMSITCTEHLSAKDNFFDNSYWTERTGGRVKGADAREWYEDFCKTNRIGPSRGRKPFGYGDLALTYGFYYATPNNSLPILWHQSSNWNALLQR